MKDESKNTRANGDGGDRHRPTKSLPTDRIVCSRQLDIGRAFALKSGPERRAVRAGDVAEMVGMAPGTVTLVNPFFTEVGLLSKTADGFIPSAEIFNFSRAYEFNAETAPYKLAEALRKSWVGEALLPKLRFRQLSQEDAISELAEAVSASSHYRGNLEMALEYLKATGLITCEDGVVKATSLAAGGQAAPPDIPKDEKKITEQHHGVSATKLEPHDTPTVAAGAVAFSINVKIDMAELSSWSADRIAALFSGIAQVVAAKKGLPEN